MNPDKVVTRYAPSPTGFQHVGGMRTALFAWLFARKHGGKFILRIEDTDKDREVEGAINHLIRCMEWLGIDWDEGPIKQSDRLHEYRKWAEVLVERGFAYPDPYTEQELAAFRTKAEEEKRPFLFRNHRPKEMLPWDGTSPLRFRVPEVKRFEWYDIVRGQLTAGEEALDDFILLKGDGYPTYNFAHIIDDHDMNVTHIMRGEEFISSTPKFLSLYDALGFERPYFATMPVILGPDGKKKLSKRDGAKDILEYQKEGYLPEAVVNFLALLGWHPEGDIEIMNTAELIQEFNVAKLQKGGALFDEQKLRWFNHQHLSRLTDEKFLAHLKSYAAITGAVLPAYTPQITTLLKERANTLQEAIALIQSDEFSFMHDSISVPSKELLLSKAQSDEASIKLHLEKIASLLRFCEPFTQEEIKNCVFTYATEVGRGAVLWPMRVALSGKEKSPDPFTVAALIGKTQTLSRIESAANIL